jgi:FKBP-type peptidyl-prolyl cis-trans isomerase FkpA
MKKYTLILIGFVMILSACGKKSETVIVDPAAQAVTDDATIQAYLKANSITNATKDASGLYYRVTTTGTGAFPTTASTITVNYTGTLLDGTQFDSTSNPGRTSFSTQLVTNGTPQVILGWVYGMQHVQTGGRIVLYIPSGLAYGPGGSGAIPANACLIFTIDLLGIK